MEQFVKQAKIIYQGYRSSFGMKEKENWSNKTGNDPYNQSSYTTQADVDKLNHK